MNNKIIFKAKGVIKDSLTLQDFEDMYLSKLSVNALKSETFKSFELATVNLNQKEIILNMTLILNVLNCLMKRDYELTQHL
jgi:hypothetical protein